MASLQFTPFTLCSIIWFIVKVRMLIAALSNIVAFYISAEYKMVTDRNDVLADSRSKATKDSFSYNLSQFACTVLDLPLVLLCLWSCWTGSSLWSPPPLISFRPCQCSWRWFDSCLFSVPVWMKLHKAFKAYICSVIHQYSFDGWNKETNFLFHLTD